MRHDPFAQCLKEVKSDKAKREIGVFRKAQRVLVAEIFKDEVCKQQRLPIDVTDEHVNKIMRYARRVLQEVLN